MRETLEREVKLEPDDASFELPELPGEPLEPRLFTSTYYDTPARSLAAVGITLRRRVENGLSRWQLKLPRHGGRAELEGTGGPAGPPPELARLLVAHVRHGALEPVATMRTRRRGIRVLAGAQPVADVVVDAVDVLDDGRAAGSFAEIEVELVGGDEDDLDRLARALRRAGAHRSSGQPKLMRVLDVDADDVPPPRKATVTEHLRFLLGRQLRELERFDPGVRLGADPEDLHRFRVATRRSRALIRASRDLLGDRLAPLAEELRWLGGALGPVRDLDVLIDHLRAQVATLDDERAGGDEIVAAFEEQRAAARDTMLDALSSDRYAALLDRFAADLAELAPRDAQGGVREIARRELKRLRKAHRALGEEPTDDELHALRIRAKRARYAAELATPVEGKRFARIVDALKELQDVIGAHQDAVVAEAKVRAVAETVAAGRLVERERARRAAARAGVPDAWRRVRRAAAAA